MKLNTLLKWTVFGSLFAVLLTPLIVSESTFFPFIAGKNIFFRTIIEVGFGAWFLLMLRDSAVRPRLSKLLWAFTAFVVVIGIADAFGMNAWKSFWSNFERMEGYITILHLFAYFLMTSTVLASEKLWKRFIEVSVGVSTIVCLYAISQHFGWGEAAQPVIRVDALLGNAIYLAVYALFHIFFLLILSVRDTVTWKRVLYGVLVFIHVAVLYYTGTRGAVLALIAGFASFACLIALFDRKEKRKRIIAGSIIGILVLVIGSFVAIRNTSFVQQSPILSRFASISLENIQSQGRYFIWPMAIKGIAEKPILGWGQENFNYIFNEHYDPRMYGQEQWFDRAHNVPLDWLVAGGIVGFLVYLSLFVAALFLLWRKSVDVSFTEKALFTGLLVAYFVNNLFVFDNITSYVMFVSVLAFIQFRSTRLVRPIGSEKKELGDEYSYIALGLILVACMTTIYFVNWKTYTTGVALRDVSYYSSVKPIQVELIRKAFEKAISHDGIGRSETVERLIEAVPAINGSNAPIEFKQNFFKMGDEAVQRALMRLPGDARYEVFAGSFYASYGQKALALEHYAKARSLSPRKQTILFALGSFYANNEEYEKALEVFKEAYELDVSNVNAAGYYASALIYAGRETEVKKFLKDTFGTEDMTADIFLQTYADMGNWTKVVELLKQKISADPLNITNRRNLADAYLALGNKTAAITALKEISKIDASLAPQVDAYIKQISK